MNNALTIRQKALTFSQKTKQNQLSSFKEWGVLADWSNNYFTCSPNYIVQQLNVFHDLHDKGIIFQDYKPVYWSPYNRTSLAEAELEYNPNHVSPSVYMKFSITKCPDVLKRKLDLNSSLFAIIWTTTPWTIPANQLVCYSADKMYSLVKCRRQNEFYLMAQEMIPSVSSTLMSELQIIETFEGTLFKDMKYRHPMSKDQECPFAPAHHVTMTKGTGLVHSAPNHGLDDFIVAKKQNLSINRCLVDENGCYTDGAGEMLKGKAVLYDGSKAVLDLLKEDILYLEQYTHSYPYDWRSKTPVIIRSSHQWFIDVHQIRDKAMEHLQKVNIVPDQLKKQFLSQLTNSPQWCISRQRVWGVPIPAFYAEDKSSDPIIHRAITDHLCSLIQKQGIHCWWELDLDQLLPHHLRIKCNLHDQKYRKCSDIMDIWFDSGISWKCVLPEPQISDVCIEGLDQIRGWFNSSLLTSIALREKAPYKTLVLHGFTTDADG
ncbi:Isoleucine--tRNA ligase, mitochondrial, partial [Stegodyphus mimosarum]